MDADNLQSILATLAQYAPANGTDVSIPPHDGSPTPPIPQEAMAPPPEMLSKEHTPATLEKLPDPRVRPQSRPGAATGTASPRPMIDPATITTWQEGLRCVTKIAASNAQFAASIQRMIKDQRANEMRWYTERQNLKQTQANRTASAAKAHTILKSLTTSLYGVPPPVDEPEVDQAKELAEFDNKLYSAQVAMEHHMTVDLKALGVPFFGTAPHLVVDDDQDVAKKPLPENQPKHSPLITKSQLLELRRRMASHLETLYRD